MILGIETSCDETAAALVTDEGEIRSNVVSSQAALHARYGGVVPEVASRRHLELVTPVIREALAEGEATLEDVDRIAVTQGPGLIGALLVGLAAAKAVAWSRRLPLVPVDHLDGHVASLYLRPDPLEPPFLCLLASGGHTMLLDVPAWGEYRLLGQTLDDAAGEAFDKVAKLLGLGYPGGAAIERLAREGRPGRFRFPRPMLQELERDGPNQYAFSFSGLKTAVLRTVRPTPGGAPTVFDDADRADIALAFQEAAVDVLTAKTARAADALGYATAVVGGGVACNRALVARLRERLAGRARVSVASPRLNTDNAAMIAAAGAWRLARGERSGWELEPRDDLPLPGLTLPIPTTGSDP